MTPVQLLAALALAFPYSAPLFRLDTVSSLTTAAEAHGVPAPILAAVCFAESRINTDARSVSLCGTRVAHRYINGALSADIAARSLARRHAECGTWPRALVAYRWGLGCGAPDANGYAGRVLRMAQRIERRSR
jgi:hypothetical protein